MKSLAIEGEKRREQTEQALTLLDVANDYIPEITTGWVVQAEMRLKNRNDRFNSTHLATIISEIQSGKIKTNDQLGKRVQGIIRRPKR